MDLPYGVPDLRPQNVVTEDTVGCHVRGCDTVVPRQRRRFRAVAPYLCREHAIYLSPTTFEYQDPWRNLLWREDVDRDLMHALKAAKRTSARLGRERDEDALTWNVFRAFHRDGRLRALAQVLVGDRQADLLPEGDPQIIYWSADRETGRLWTPLERARRHFGEVVDRGTEPDIILSWPGEYLVFVEAKFSATNATRPSAKPPDADHRPRAYADNSHFRLVFTHSYQEIAVEGSKYELMRMWLLGTWMAERDEAAFSLVNLVCWGAETDIGRRFGQQFCRQGQRRRFVRATWEGIRNALPEAGLRQATATALEQYFGDKSAGYDNDGLLRRAFLDSSARESLTGSAATTTHRLCPRCGSTFSLPIAYGYPTKETMRRAEAGEMTLGGCIVDPDAPGRECQDCGTRR